MALVVFLRGVNVGGRRRFRPSLLARELADHDVVNVGAAGTFVVRKPGPRAAFRTELLRRLPFETEIALCEGRDLLRLEKPDPFAADPFAADPCRPDLVRFLSVLTRPARSRPAVPIGIPPDREWLVRVVGRRGRFVFGVYRRQMKAIGCLGRIDELFGAPATTRNWNTVRAIVAILEQAGPGRS